MGFDPKAIPGNRFGLEGIRQRARLVTTHKGIDKAVDACYGPVSGRIKPTFDTDLSRVKYLFERYAAIIAAGQMNLNLSGLAKPKRGARPR